MRPPHDEQFSGLASADPAHGDAGMNAAESNTAPAPHNSESGVRGSLIVLVVVLLIVAAVLAVFGIAKRKHANAELTNYTNEVAAPPVSLTKPVFERNATEIVLPGNIQAYTLAPIYARTAGYVKAWYHDIGSHVRKGELLAVIETPELDQQLAQAKADLATAQSNAALAKLTATRYRDLIQQNAVSQQDTDNAIAQLEARNTQVTSAEANVRRIEQLQSFERIVAPFDGVITARNLDVGQLVSSAGSTTTPGAGNITSSKAVFDISAIQTLRVFINVPQVYAPDAKNGVTATLIVPQYPGRIFHGKLVRSSDAMDPATRTLLAEIDVDNHSGELLPGSYTEVHLNVANPAPALIIPISALIYEPDGLHVAIVDATQHAHIVRVTPGRDSGSTMEILGGLDANQSVISNPPDSLTDGEQVRVVKPSAEKQP